MPSARFPKAQLAQQQQRFLALDAQNLARRVGRLQHLPQAGQEEPAAGGKEDIPLAHEQQSHRRTAERAISASTAATGRRNISRKTTT